MELILNIDRDSDGMFKLYSKTDEEFTIVGYFDNFIYEDGVLSLYDMNGFEMLTINENKGVLKILFNEKGNFKYAYNYTTYEE